MARFRWNPETKQLESLDEDWTDVERRAPVPTEELVYGGLGTATDGEPINSRRKHAEYMKRHGLALHSDFTETRAKAAKEREALRTGNRTEERKEIRQLVGRAMYDAWKGRRPRRGQ